MFQVLRDGTRTIHSVPLCWTLNVLNVFIWTIFFHPQILRNLHPWIHPCVLVCLHLSVTHELRFRFVWVQKWLFDLRVSICSLHLRLWSGSVWRFWSHSRRSIVRCPCVYWVMCLSVICNKQGSCWSNGCPKQDWIGLDLNRIFWAALVPHIQPYNCASHFIEQIISSSTSKELHKMPQQLPHRPKLISPLCYGNTGVFQLWRDH